MEVELDMPQLPNDASQLRGEEGMVEGDPGTAGESPDRVGFHRSQRIGGAGASVAGRGFAPSARSGMNVYHKNIP